MGAAELYRTVSAVTRVVDTRVQNVPVVIVGGGPAGLCLSILLSRHGVASLLVERRHTVNDHPRARGISTRTMELFRLWGIEHDVRQERLEVHDAIAYSSTLAGPELKRIGWHRPPPAGSPEPSPTKECLCPQDRLEPLLWARARSYREASFMTGVEFRAQVQDRRGVTSTLNDVTSGKAVEIRSNYLVGADGARSAVRSGAAIPVTPDEAVGRQLSILFQAPLTSLLSGGPCRQHNVRTPTAQGSFFLYGRDDRWIFATRHREDLLDAGGNYDPALCLRLVREAAGVQDLDVELLGMTGWTMSTQCARRYRRGRVYLVGDSAHRMTPAGALGMNTAIHDAHNLGWKLGAVLSGWSAPALLATYETERLPIGRRNTARTMFTGRPPQRTPDLSAVAMDLGTVYASRAIIDDGTPAPPNPTGDYVPSARPGARAPHLWLEREGGRLSTVDLFDTSFTLLTGPDGGAWRRVARRLSTELRIPVAVVGVGVELADPAGAWPEVYGVTASGAVLVRPDGHVCFRRRGAVSGPSGVLGAALLRATGRARAVPPGPVLPAATDRRPGVPTPPSSPRD